MSSIKEEELIIKDDEEQRQEEQEPEQIGEDGDEEDEEPEDDGESEDLTISNLEATTIATPIASAPPLNGKSYQTPPPPQQTPTTAAAMGTARSIISTASGDESRKLFQRLWTDEDEIGLLQGFLDFNTQRGTLNSSYHHETGPFYDHIKNRLNLDFNKSQLVEKLRRLKKKYRNVVARVNSGKDFNFKTHHDQTTFEISRKIWSGSHNCSNIVDETLVIMEDDNTNNNNESTGNAENKTNVCVNADDEKDSRVMGAVSSTLLRKRGVKRPAEEELMKTFGNKEMESNSVSSVIEETVKSFLTPLFKEFVNCAMNGQCNVGLLGFNGMGLNPLGVSKDEVIDEKWRKQQILELEVYSKRVELVQEQIKSALEDLKSTGS